MKFVLVITNLAGGGAEKIILTLATGLSQRGHQTEVILLERVIEHEVPDCLNLTALTTKASKGWLGKRLLAHRLRRYVLALSPDLTVSALPFANEVAILAGLPNHWCRIDNTLGAEVAKIAARNPGKARRRLARYRNLLGSRPLIAISDNMVADLRLKIGITGRIEKIPNPFDLDAIRKSAESQTADRPSKPYVIHVGRFNAQKRHDVLLDAWKAIVTDRILVLLTAPEPELLAMIEQRGLTQRVLIPGFKPNPYPWISGAELLILSSDHEGLPGVLIEALACGTPAVSTDCPSGPREILAAFPECLVPCGDAASLAQVILRALASPPDPAKADLTPYSINKVAAAYEGLAAEA